MEEPHPANYYSAEYPLTSDAHVKFAEPGRPEEEESSPLS
jgi:hypothetical protein